jgi:hypothetical protein
MWSPGTRIGALQNAPGLEKCHRDQRQNQNPTQVGFVDLVSAVGAAVAGVDASAVLCGRRLGILL